MMIQSVIFDKDKFDLRKAVDWMHKHKFRFIKIHETKKFIRFRLIPPNLLRLKGYTHFKTKTLDDDVKVIVAF